MNVLTRPWTHMFDFKGRATRREYWLFILVAYFGLLVLGALMLLISAIFVPLEELTSPAAPTSPASPAAEALGALFGLLVLAYMIAWFIASLSVSVRRLHDHDKSGWFLLIGLFPLFGWIFSLVMMLIPGNPYENSYGPDPRQGEPLGDTAEIFA
jgi:uncharacterized membrane protein YhaH (DUF805 family)